MWHHLATAQPEIPYHGIHTTHLPQWVQLMYSPDADPTDIVTAYETYFAKHAPEKNEHTQYYKRWLRHIARSLPTDGRQPADQRYLHRRNQELSNTRTLPSQWQSIGPWDWDHDAADRSYAPGAAHVYVVEQAASNPDVLYAGTATAGIWKSTDHGSSWTCVTNNLLINNCTALEINHQVPTTVYAEILSSVYKTTNAGASWTPTGDVTFQALSLDVKDLMMHPADTTLVLAATNSGLFRTDNAGANWTEVLSGNVLETEFHPTDHDTIYAVRNSGDITEFFRSTDNGLTFTQLSNGWPVPDVGAGEHQKRTELAVSADAPDKVFALATGSANGGSGLYGMYVSTDAGENWTFNCCGPQPAGPPSPTNQNLMGWSDQGTDDGGQYYYDLALDVSPTNADSVYVAGVNLWVSDDGGMSFVCPAKWSHSYKPNYVHADIHDVHYYASSGEIWIACDGGIFWSDDDGANFTRKINGISGTDFWGFGTGFWEGDVMLGGTYHNGTLLKDNDVYLNGWISTDGGDNYRGFVNPALDRQVYSDYNIKELSGDRLINNATRSFQYKPNATYTVGRSSELLFHPLYYGTWFSGSGTALWKTEDNGFTFQLVHDFGEDLASMAVSWSDPDVLYVCTFPDWWGLKRIFRTVDGGGNWTEITPPAALLNNTNTWVPYDIEVDALDPDKVWILRTSMYGGTDLNGVAVFTSDNGGQTWLNLTTPTLDGQAFTALMHQKGTNGGIYLGTRTSVWYRNDTMPDWEIYSAGLPATTNCTRLLPYYRKGIVRNASNRSVWERDFYEPSQPVAQASAFAENSYCLTDTIFFRDRSVMSELGASWLWSFPGGVPAASSGRNPKVLYSKPGIYDVTLTVTDIHGTDTRTFEQMMHIQNHCGLDTVPGKALACLSNPDHVILEPIGITTDSFTVTAWIRPDTIQDNYTGIVMNDGSAAGFNFRESNNTLGYHWPGGAWWWDSGLVAKPNEWSYVAMVVTPAEVRLYVNGIEAVHVTSVTPVELGTMRIGSYQGWGSRNYRGLIDEVTLWNRSLTKEEIREQRHLTRLPADDPSMIGYYQFNAGGSTVFDKAGSANGTLNGNAGKVRSRAPVGAGKSQSLTINAAGKFDFSDIGLSLVFNPGAIVPGGMTVASHLHVPPDTLPFDDVPMDIGYWILNNYGAQTVISTPDTVSCSDLAFVSGSMTQSMTARLWERGANAELIPWFEIDSTGMMFAGVAGSATHSEVTGLTTLGQLHFSRDSVPEGIPLGTLQPLTETVAGFRGGSSVLLDLKGINQGLLLPGMSQPGIEQIPSPAAGLCVYHTEEKTLCFFDGATWQLLERDFVSQPNPDTASGGGGVGIGTSLIHPSAVLHLDQGALLPNAFSDTSITNIDYPGTGVLIYNNSLQTLQVFDGIDWRGLDHGAGTIGVNTQSATSSIGGVAIGATTKDPNTVLELVSDARAIRIPIGMIETIPSPAEGLVIFDVNHRTLCLFDGELWWRIPFR